MQQPDHPSQQRQKTEEMVRTKQMTAKKSTSAKVPIRLLQAAKAKAGKRSKPSKEPVRNKTRGPYRHAISDPGQEALLTGLLCPA